MVVLHWRGHREPIRMGRQQLISAIGAQTQIGRYSVIAVAPTAGQQDLLSVTRSITIRTTSILSVMPAVVVARFWLSPGRSCRSVGENHRHARSATCQTHRAFRADAAQDGGRADCRPGVSPGSGSCIASLLRALCRCLAPTSTGGAHHGRVFLIIVLVTALLVGVESERPDQGSVLSTRRR